jgi:cell volume regulation protein A
LVYLALGMALGSSGAGLRFNDAQLAQLLGTCALVVILAEGGLTTRWSTMRPVLATAVSLATVGVVVSSAVVAVAAHYLLDIEWRLALLAGAVLSSTDAAAVFSLLRRLRLAPRVSAALEAESGLNDAPGVLFVTLLTTGAFGAGHEIGFAVALIVYELIAGAAIGALLGFGGVWLLRRSALPAAGLYPLAAIAITVLAYGVGSLAHASGFLAVYIAGVVLGNARLPHRRAVVGFADGLAWLAQIGLFVLLGLLVNPDELDAVIIPALVLGGVLVFVARPVSVLAAAPREPWRYQLFWGWAGLRGAVPIVLATIPLAAGIEGARWLFNVVFLLVVVFTLLQGATLPSVARAAKVVQASEPLDLRVESAPLEELDADLLQLGVAPGSGLVGVYIDELRLPVGASASLLLRGGVGSVPSADTRLVGGDEVLIVTPHALRSVTEARLRSVALGGRLAEWRVSYCRTE